jgi:predicted N-formylglutamate amidohydrolase
LTPPTFSALLVTCEHASNAVPARWRKAFAADRAVLKTHRAWDPGAVILARELAREFDAPVFEGGMTRLLIDLNRRNNSTNAFSEFTPASARAELGRIHNDWRDDVRFQATELVATGRLLHISCHSFTPVLRGQVRNAEIGLLYDPRRKLEKSVADSWTESLSAALPNMRIRRNYPYTGISDGLTTWLRRKLPEGKYAGFEIELNQAFCAKPARSWATVRQSLIGAIRQQLGAKARRREEQL